MRIGKLIAVTMVVGLVLWTGGALDRLLGYVFQFVRDDVRAMTEAEEATVIVTVKDVPPSVTESAEFGYLLVRYGNNEQVDQHIATDDERRNLQNRDHAADADRDDRELKLTLPVRRHPRLGTEFKTFAELPDAETAEQLADTFAESENISEASISPVNDRRVYVLLERLPTTESPDGYVNNFLPPK